MRYSGRLLWIFVCLGIGALLAGLFCGSENATLAANDHFEDFILCTGAVSADVQSHVHWNPASHAYRVHKEAIPVEGVWLLDYRSGKLLATAIDRAVGKIVG